MDELKKEYNFYNELYKGKKTELLIQLKLFSAAIAPNVDSIQNEMDLMRRELYTIKKIKKALKKLVKIYEETYISEL